MEDIKDWQEEELIVEGMTCTACVNSIRQYLEGQGAREVFVDLPRNKVSFRHEVREGDLADITAGIESLGYRVTGQRPKSWLTIRRKVIISAILTAPLLIDHLLHLAGSGVPGLHNPWVQFALTLPVFFIGLGHFGRSALGAIRHGQSNMDVLIFMGSTAAFVYSCVGLALMDPKYYFFETSAMIITLVLVGNWLESRALTGTTSAIDALEKLKTETARLWLGKEQYMDIPASEVRSGDRIMVNTGEGVPADGVILEGEGEVNEAALTGESVPLHRKAGDPVFAGSVLSSGNVVMQANVDASQTLFNQIIRLVKAAQSDRPPIQRLADKISAWFVPLVILIAVGAYFLGIYVLGATPAQALMNAIAVLVISCPCAMGLATPTAITVGLGRMTRQGLLIKGAETIEILAKVRKILFDKTGTLTTGVLKVRAIKTRAGQEAEARQILYQMELRSTHPLAKAILQYLGNTQVSDLHQLTEVTEAPGIGLEAHDASGRHYVLGRDDLDNREGYHLSLTRDGEKLAHIHLEDELRPDAATVIQALKDRGYACAIVSGDREANVDRVAEQTGIGEVHARQLPADKYALIDSMKDQGNLAMVGDGINDAPALQRASVGIAMAGATATALQSARVALMKQDLHDLVALFDLSKLTVRTIRENLFWAFSYNIVAIPMAVMGLLNPMWGALFMAFSDLVVIGNSLRLKRR